MIFRLKLFFSPFIFYHNDHWKTYICNASCNNWKLCTIREHWTDFILLYIIIPQLKNYYFDIFSKVPNFIVYFFSLCSKNKHLSCYNNPHSPIISYISKELSDNATINKILINLKYELKKFLFGCSCEKYNLFLLMLQ